MAVDQRPRLQQRNVTFEPLLTLPPSDSEEGDDFEYEDALADLLGGEQGHWVRGHAPDTVLLLHLSYDEPLGFEFLDGGTIQFRIASSALAAGDWSAATAEADSS